MARRAGQLGGLEFPFTFKGITYDKDSLEKALNHGGQYYTHAFHKNCRSKLVPVTENSGVMKGRALTRTEEEEIEAKADFDPEIAKTIVRGTENHPDLLDEVIMTDGAPGALAEMEFAVSDDVSDHVKEGYFTSKQFVKKIVMGNWVRNPNRRRRR